MAEAPSLPTVVEVGAAVLQLRPLEREVLWLAAGEHLANDAIARRLGITIEQAERLLAAALGNLDRAMDGRERS